MEFRRRLTLTIALAALAAVAVPLALSIAPRAFAADAPTATASVVRVDNYRAPRKVVVHHRFRPWAHPTPGQVREIIRNEARRWGVPAAALSARVGCESRFHWWASNGQFQGVLQFGPNAFYRGLRTIRSYKITLVRSKMRKVHDARITQYSDGTKVRQRTTPRRQRLIVVYSARLPRHPSVGDTFAQIRIGAQALRGISAVHSSEWSCGA
jgi:hypothetical protein